MLIIIESSKCLGNYLYICKYHVFFFYVSDKVCLKINKTKMKFVYGIFLWNIKIIYEHVIDAIYRLSLVQCHLEN